MLGRPDAPVTLVEYGDLQCPYCSAWTHEALPVLVDEYVRPGKLRIEFRGMAFIGPESETGLRAALAAGEQDKLWHVVDLLYRNQGHENSGWLNDETLRLVGSSVPGLDVERMLDRRDVRGARGVRGLRGRGRHHRHAVVPGRADGRAADARPDLVLDAGALRPAIDKLLSR